MAKRLPRAPRPRTTCTSAHDTAAESTVLEPASTRGLDDEPPFKRLDTAVLGRTSADLARANRLLEAAIGRKYADPSVVRWDEVSDDGRTPG
jgi:hypothetical protein